MFDGKSKAHQSTTKLNANATEFIPTSEQAFRNDYPSLSVKLNTKLSIRREEKTTSFQEMVSKPITISELPQAQSAIPQGFVSLSRDKRNPRDDNIVEQVIEEKPIQQSIKDAFEGKFSTSKKKKLTRRKVTEWQTPAQIQGIGVESTTVMIEEIPERMEKRVESRFPGYFFHLAAQSRVKGQSAIPYLDDGQWAPEKMKSTIEPLPYTPLEASSEVVQIRETWLEFVKSTIQSPQLSREHLERVQIFLNHHRNLLLWDERDEERRSVWHIAAIHGHDEVLQVLHSYGDGVDARDRKKQTPLHLAAAHGHASTCKYLISLGASTTNVDKNGNTPLHAACRSGKVATTKLLISKGKLESRNKNRETPLWLAVYAAATDSTMSDGMEVVQLLLASGASTLVSNNKGHTPLYIALEDKSSMKLIELLLVYGFPVASTSVSSILHRAVLLGNVDALALLLHAAPTQEWLVVEKEYGDTILHAAIRYGHGSKCIPLLCSKSSKLLVKENSKLQTPLFLAVDLEDYVSLDALLSHGGYPNERNRWNESVLYHAIQYRKLSCVRVLINFGARLDLKCVDLLKQIFSKPKQQTQPAQVRSWIHPDLRVLCTADNSTGFIHRCMLVGRCEVFRAQLCGLWASPAISNEISIHCNGKTFEILKEYIYFGQLQDYLETDEVVDVLVVANSLLLIDLQHVCISRLRSMVSPEDLADIASQLGIGQVMTRSLSDRLKERWKIDMQLLLNEGWFADVTIETKNKTQRQCHHAVVSGFTDQLSFQSSKNLELNYTAEVVDLLLYYMYTESLELEVASRESILQLIEAALELKIPGCVEYCETFIVNEIAKWADLDLLHFATVHELENLQAACRIHLLEHFVNDKDILLSCLS